MTVSSGAALGGSVPRRLVGARYRMEVERGRLFVAFVPALILAVVALAFVAFGVVAFGPLGGLFAFTFLSVLGSWQRRRLSRVVQRPWWRFEFRWACRSAGLARFAEADIDTDHTPNEETFEVVPFLVSLRLLPSGRRYTVRPLPGQALADFEKVTAQLAIRWRAESVTVARGTGRRGRGHLVVTVVKGSALDRPPTWR